MIRSEYLDFLTIYEMKSLSGASDRLDLQQGTLSKILNKLEASENTQLFIRTNRGLLPTEKADQLYTQILQQKKIWESFKNQSSANKELQGQIKIGGHSTVLSRLSKYFSKIIEENPHFDLDFVFGRSPEIARKLQHHEIDIAFIVNPRVYSNIVLKELLQEEVCFYTENRDFNRNLIFFNPEMLSSFSIIKKYKKSRWHPIANYNLVAHMAKNSHGLALLPQCVAKDFNLSHKVGKPLYIAKYFLSYRSDGRERDLIRKFSHFF